MRPSGVLIIAGPTASGKTQLALRLAKQFGAEIVGADSRQVYAGMEIGTAAATTAERAEVPHHLVGFLDPRERYSAARFSQDAVAAIHQIHARGKRAIVAGGTGFYIRALTGVVALAPERDEQLRARLARETRVHELAFLHEWLRLRDARRAAAISAQDTYRVARALEVALLPEQMRARELPLLSLSSENIPFLKVALHVEPLELDRRIEHRTNGILAGGLLDEAERVGADAVAASAVGYPQALAYLRGWCTMRELQALLVRYTRRYAKRQATWFRSEPHMHDVPADAVERLAREKLGWV